jgi:hypothetical protein
MDPDRLPADGLGELCLQPPLDLPGRDQNAIPLLDDKAVGERQTLQRGLKPSKAIGLVFGWVHMAGYFVTKTNCQA